MTAMSSMPGMMPGAMPGMAQPGQQQDFNKLFLAEKENVIITPHIWDLEDVEERLLRKYGKAVTKKAEAKKSVAAAASTPVKEISAKDKIKAAQKNNSNKRR